MPLTLLATTGLALLHGTAFMPDLDETIGRLRAYSQAGADCLYAPGIRTRGQIAAAVAGVAPKPLNLLIGWVSELTMQDIAELGVRRVSVGGALARAAWGAFMRASRLIAEQGKFDPRREPHFKQAYADFVVPLHPHH